jgi:hypothetical protein
MSNLNNIVGHDNSGHVTSQLYPANFNDSSFLKYQKMEFNRIGEDDQLKEGQNQQRLKYYTNNFADLIRGQAVKDNFFGLAKEDNLWVPSPEVIDKYSNLVNGKQGLELTNPKIKNEFGMLPMQAPYLGQSSHGDVDIEDSIRNNIQVKKNSCLPRDSDYEQRSFAIFDPKQNIELPQAIKSVETPEAGFKTGQVGINTRFDNRFKKMDPSAVKNVDIKNIQGSNIYKYLFKN